MIVYEVSVNGEVRCRAGIGEGGALLADLHFCPTNHQDLIKLIAEGKVKPIVPMLSLTGEKDDEWYDWLHERCEVGTEITIRVIEAEATDVPQKRPQDASEELSQLTAQKAAYLVLKAKFENEGSDKTVMNRDTQ